MVMLHIGVHVDMIDGLIEALPGDDRAYYDGDSWEEWGEVPTSKVRHVAIKAPGTPEALSDIAWLIEQGVYLHPMRWGYEAQIGTIASITREDEWSEEFLHVKARFEGEQKWWVEGRCILAASEDDARAIYQSAYRSSVSVRPWNLDDRES